MDKKERFKYLKYLPGILLGAAFELPLKYASDSESQSKLPRLVGFVIVAAGISFLVFLIDVIVFYVKARKRKSAKNSLIKLDELGNQFQLQDGTKMFDVDNGDIILMEDIENTESWLKRLISNLNQVIYHSITAKDNFPWVEYVFWSFLRKAKELLGCKIVISLHYDEESRENGIDNKLDRQRYKELQAKYAAIARCTLGNDIEVIDEEDFHLKNGKFFAKNFHNLFVKRMLIYVRQLEEGNLDYLQLKRKLSYLESVFPIMCLTEKINRWGRLYILDRLHAHEVWDEDEKLNMYKKRHGILLLTAQTLLKADGAPLQIFMPGDTIDINTSNEKISACLAVADETVKKNLLLLLSACLNKSRPTDFTDLDNKCRNIVIEVRTQLKLTDDLMC